MAGHEQRNSVNMRLKRSHDNSRSLPICWAKLIQSTISSLSTIMCLGKCAFRTIRGRCNSRAVLPQFSGGQRIFYFKTKYLSGRAIRAWCQGTVTCLVALGTLAFPAFFDSDMPNCTAMIEGLAGYYHF